MKILYVLNNYPPNIIGGAELIASKHLRLLQASGNICHVFAGEHSGAHSPYSVNEDVYEKIPVTRISIGHKQTSWEYENFQDQKIENIFYNNISRICPDIVHFHNLPGLSVNLIDIAKKQNIHTVLTAHDHWGFCHRQTLTKPNGNICHNFTECEICQPTYQGKCGRTFDMNYRNEHIKKMFLNLDLLISPSQYLLHQYQKAGCIAKSNVVVSNGVDLISFFPKKEKRDLRELRIGIASHLSRHKGIAAILEAIASLPGNLPLKFIFAGKGPMEKDILSFIKNSNNGSYVEFIGNVSPNKMPEFYHKIDIFLAASLWPENQPCTIMEAMASGLAVIATNIGGNPELVSHNKSGQLINAFNIHELTNSFLSYIKNHIQAVNHGAAGGRIISRDNMLQSINRLKNIYLNLKCGRSYNQ